MTPTSPGEKYAMVKKEEVLAWWKENMAPIPAEANSLWPFFERALRERDAYREGWITEYWRHHIKGLAAVDFPAQHVAAIADVDAEALKLLTPTEGK